MTYPMFFLPRKSDYIRYNSPWKLYFLRRFVLMFFCFDNKVTFRFKRGGSVLGNVKIVADGYVAPITAGNLYVVSSYGVEAIL